MIALFDEPPRVTLRSDRYPINSEHTVGLLLGIATDAKHAQAHGIVCTAEGNVVILPPAAYNIDWRYDVENDRFIDLSVAKGDQED